MEFKVPFGLRAHKYSEEEVATTVALMRGEVPLTQAVNLKEFESKFSQYADVDHAFAVSSATAGLEIAAKLCQFEPGDEVIMPRTGAMI